MEEAIKNFAKQFEYEPVVENSDKLGSFKKYVVVGMGGSHLAAGLINIINPKKEIVVHSDYGLPFGGESLGEYLIIASSYSGNTKEVIDALNTAIQKKLNIAVISTGGKLLEEAIKKSLPYIKIPNTDIQPRSALGFSFRAILKLIEEDGLLEESRKIALLLKPIEFEEQGKALADLLRGAIPIIYSSTQNRAIAYNWKIKFNETGKIPAFYNVFPELNHNEMTGFDVKESTKTLTDNFYFIFLKDHSDNPGVTKRMDILEKLLKDRGLKVEAITMKGKTATEKIFSSLLVADWAALHTAYNYGLDPEQVPMIEEFKKMM